MFGLTILQEAALAMVWLRQDELAVDMTSAGLTKELLALRDQGMIRMQNRHERTVSFCAESQRER